MHPRDADHRRDVLEYLAGGMTVPELLDDFPELTADDIRACLAFCGRPTAGAGRVSLLFDQNLSRRLPALLADEFPGSEQVLLAGLATRRRPGGVGLRGGPRAGGRLEGRGFPAPGDDPRSAPEGDLVAGGQRADPGRRSVAAVEGGGHPGVPGRSDGVRARVAVTARVVCPAYPQFAFASPRRRVAAVACPPVRFKPLPAPVGKPPLPPADGAEGSTRPTERRGGARGIS